MLRTKTIIQHSGLGFGTSGVRGLVNQLTAEVCQAFTHAFISVMRDRFTFKHVALGIDNRPSSLGMAGACAAALQQLGVEPLFYGVLPTPALALQAMRCRIPAIMVTGSHIPHDRNGLKFYGPGGEITKAEERQILEADIVFSKIMAQPMLQPSTEAAERYTERYLHFFNKSALAHKRIGIYEHSSAGRDIYPSIFQALGATVIRLGRSDDFIPIDTEALSTEDEQRALSWTQQYSLDALFSTDGDGDRPMLADEQGHWLKGDILGLLCCQYLGIQSLAMPLNCNSAVEQSGIATRVIRTRIGSPYVLEAMGGLAGKFAGFEANGGFMLGSSIDHEGRHLAALPTRDALLPALAALILARETGLAAILATLPSRFTHSDRIKVNPTAFMQKAISNRFWLLETLGLAADIDVDIDMTDGIRMQLPDHRIIHLRASANAPELRCYAEAKSQLEARTLVEKTLYIAIETMNSWNNLNSQ
ncbi:phosphomannomutase [Aeromonas hydrophila]|uniref:Phosphomannomutase n=1 Tax=Aeromonas hydrophila TaxID=644 RepID=A0AAX3P598_AERHY|nr:MULTISPECIES: phosphomannomutase [Aeromonas]GKQ60109.1 phosphomannomutase [Aeromonas caviae]HDT5861182.1 phosphomannomutase [Aeromonas hydrophila subsp. hydrophila]MCO4116055.1 phosphomannomutase [Aeromonas hydrophila]MCV9381781.1 phosphomannomutase [Aeromonas hydrophila]MDD9226060.1 phosphomannomutase [Aeromonas hydrophila]